MFCLIKFDKISIMASIADKLKIKPGNSLRVINGPIGFSDLLGDLPEEVKINNSCLVPDQVHWFVNSIQQVKDEVCDVMKILKEEKLLWVYFPKKTSKLQTDLTRDARWEPLLEHKLQWLVLISLNETWSGFAMKRKTNESGKKTLNSAAFLLKDHVDPVRKIIKIPADMGHALEKDPYALKFFDQLSFTNRKEYLEWIISAKKDETRKSRIQKMMEKLKNKNKNPYAGG
jgi:hypothetical protein